MYCYKYVVSQLSLRPPQLTLLIIKKRYGFLFRLIAVLSEFLAYCNFGWIVDYRDKNIVTNQIGHIITIIRLTMQQNWQLMGNPYVLRARRTQSKNAWIPLKSIYHNYFFFVIFKIFLLILPMFSFIYINCNFVDTIRRSRW